MESHGGVGLSEVSRHSSPALTQVHVHVCVHMYIKLIIEVTTSTTQDLHDIVLVFHRSKLIEARLD